MHERGRKGVLYCTVQLAGDGPFSTALFPYISPISISHSILCCWKVCLARETIRGLHINCDWPRASCFAGHAAWIFFSQVAIIDRLGLPFIQSFITFQLGTPVRLDGPRPICAFPIEPQIQTSYLISSLCRREDFSCLNFVGSAGIFREPREPVLRPCARPRLPGLTIDTTLDILLDDAICHHSRETASNLYFCIVSPFHICIDQILRGADPRQCKNVLSIPHRHLPLPSYPIFCISLTPLLD